MIESAKLEHNIMFLALAMISSSTQFWVQEVVSLIVFDYVGAVMATSKSALEIHT